MTQFFGTDGIRGVVNENFTCQLLYNCGNALGQLFPNSKILIGQDTRGSGNMFVNAFSCGAMDAGINVTNVGICPTAGICYLTKKFNFDFGVIISASHNPANYNGIKIVDKTGEKITEKLEERIEQKLTHQVHVNKDKIGTFFYKKNYVNRYKNFLCSYVKYDFPDYKIVIDCANGTASKIATCIFRKTKAKILAINCKPNGNNINQNCGSTNISNLQKCVIKNKANFGFAFDGDSDRVIAVDENGNVIDGDKILYLFSLYYLEKKLLKKQEVVGTILTSLSLEKALKKINIKLVRTQVGDKNINAELNKKKLILGGESSGHIFDKTKLMTGDGILNAITITNICYEKQKELSKFFNFEKYFITTLNCDVDNKKNILLNTDLQKYIKKEQQTIKNEGRIIVRPSGTEPIIRINVETKNKIISEKIANNILKLIKNN